MITIRFYRFDGNVPTKVNPSDSGYDVTAVSLKLRLVDLENNQVEFDLLTEDDYIKLVNNADNPTVLRLSVMEFVISSLRSIQYEILSGRWVTAFMVYGTGLKGIYPIGIDLLEFMKSSRFKKAPALSLENGVGIVDTNYRGEILAIYQVNTAYLPYLFHCNAEVIAYAIYLPSDEVVQLKPTQVLNTSIIKLDHWEESYNLTDRGTGGHGSTEGKPKIKEG